MKKIILRYFSFLSILFFAFAANAQVSTFTQYNGSLSAINPAYIANINKNQLSLIYRNQWPGYRLGSITSEIAFNKFTERINSSFGLVVNYSYNTQGSYKNFTQQFQYGYRLLFLEKYYLNFGAGVEHQQNETDVNNFYYLFQPKAIYISLPEENIKSEKLNASAGFIFQDTDPHQYIGFSIRNRQLTEISNFGSRTIHTDPTYSLQAMKQILAVDRETQMLFSVIAEHSGKISYNIQDTGKKNLQPAFYYLMGQINLFRNKAGIIGVGYKYFSQNYGVMTFRIAAYPNFGIPFFLGYSFDTKPFIQNDKIHFYSSHEFYFKINF